MLTADPGTQTVLDGTCRRREWVEDDMLRAPLSHLSNFALSLWFSLPAPPALSHSWLSLFPSPRFLSGSPHLLGTGPEGKLRDLREPGFPVPSPGPAPKQVSHKLLTSESRITESLQAPSLQEALWVP